MMKQKQSGPRNVSQLMPWLQTQFGNLELALHQKHQTPPEGADVSYRESVNQLASSLYYTVGHLRDVLLSLSPPLEDGELLDQIARAVAVSGNSSGLDAAIRSEINRFREASEEIVRWSRDAGISAPIRDELVAGWKRTVGHHLHNLQMLGVSIEDVEVGSRVVAGEHRIDRWLSSSDPHKLETVETVVTPRFVWTNNLGQACYEPARVWAYRQYVDSDAPPQETHEKTQRCASAPNTSEVAHGSC